MRAHYRGAGSFLHPALVPGRNAAGRAGLFARDRIAAGTVLAVLEGRTLDRAEAERLLGLGRGEAKRPRQIGEGLWLVPRANDRAGRLGHSCLPNAGFDGARPLADTLVAMRSIEEGEEVAYHYAMSEADLPFRIHPCDCMARECRGSVDSEMWRDPVFFKRYGAHMASYLRRRHLEDGAGAPQPGEGGPGEGRALPLWVGGFSVESHAFTLELAEVEVAIPTPAALAHELEPALRILEEARTSISSPGEVVVRSAEHRSVWRRIPEGLSVAVQIEARPRAVLRALERAAFALRPRAVRLWRGAESSPRVPYRRGGLLFARVLHEERSERRQIALAEHPVYGRAILLDGATRLAQSDEAIFHRALATLGLHEGVRRACVLGGGDGGVARELLSAGLPSVVVVEPDRALPAFVARHMPEVPAGALEDRRVELRHGPIGEYLEGLEAAFDLVLCDLTEAPSEGLDEGDLVERIGRALRAGGRAVFYAGDCSGRMDARQAQLQLLLKICFEEVRSELHYLPSSPELSCLLLFARSPRAAMVRNTL